MRNIHKHRPTYFETILNIYVFSVVFSATYAVSSGCFVHTLHLHVVVIGYDARKAGGRTASDYQQWDLEFFIPAIAHHPLIPPLRVISSPYSQRKYLAAGY